jgi:hypothetical protein
VFALLWLPAVNGVFFGVVDSILSALGIHEIETYCGLELFRFWQDTSGLCSVAA